MRSCGKRTIARWVPPWAVLLLGSAFSCPQGTLIGQPRRHHSEAHQCKAKVSETLHGVVLRDHSPVLAQPDGIGLQGTRVLVASSVVAVNGQQVPEPSIVSIDTHGDGQLISGGQSQRPLLYPRIISGTYTAYVVAPEGPIHDASTSSLSLVWFRLKGAGWERALTGPKFRDADWLASGAASFTSIDAPWSMAVRETERDFVLRGMLSPHGDSLVLDSIALDGIRLTRQARLSGNNQSQVLVISALVSRVGSRSPSLLALPVVGLRADTSRAIELSRFSGQLPRAVGTAFNGHLHAAVWRNETGNPASGYALLGRNGRLIAQGGLPGNTVELTDPIPASTEHFIVGQQSADEKLHLIELSRSGSRTLLEVPMAGNRPRMILQAPNLIRVVSLQTRDVGGHAISQLATMAVSIRCRS